VFPHAIASHPTHQLNPPSIPHHLPTGTGIETQDRVSILDKATNVSGINSEVCPLALIEGMETAQQFADIAPDK
jgi:hypothetical protein